MQIVSASLVLAGHSQPAVGATSASQESCGLFGEAENRSGVKGRKPWEGRRSCVSAVTPSCLWPLACAGLLL